MCTHVNILKGRHDLKMHMVCVSVRMYACIDLCVDMNVFYVNIDADTGVDINVDMLDLHRVQLDYTCGTLVCVCVSLFLCFSSLCSALRLSM